MPISRLALTQSIILYRTFPRVMICRLSLSGIIYIQVKIGLLQYHAKTEKPNTLVEWLMLARTSSRQLHVQITFFFSILLFISQKKKKCTTISQSLFELSPFAFPTLSPISFDLAFLITMSSHIPVNEKAHGLKPYP